MSLRLGRVLALGICGFGTWGFVSAQGQDSPDLSRALERAEKFDVGVGLGMSQQPVAKWVAGDRVAYSPAGKAPWAILEASTGRVLESDVKDGTVGGPGPIPADNDRPTLNMSRCCAADRAAGMLGASRIQPPCRT